MYVFSSASTTPVASVPVPTREPLPKSAISEKGTFAGSVQQRIDFSHMTPRQLHAYIDEMIFADQISPDDAGSLFGSIPLEWYEERPDTPIDVMSNIKDIADFDRNNGYPELAQWYDGLLERMKTMEARSVHISIRA
ncbi:hypothetical protein [Xanthomonas sp. NCPPB 2632]|jgi:hypothetical protein|uniref:hypothetical protein n=1 Tax=Xanthomonas sp. NCPPB 2632 TaxID=3240912 RepID=UPI003516CA6A